jgi:hypothetical protein
LESKIKIDLRGSGNESRRGFYKIAIADKKFAPFLYAQISK